MTLGDKERLVQTKDANLLAVGEPAPLMFNIKAEKVGNFRLRVRATNDGAPGETHNMSLKLIVNGGPGETGAGAVPEEG